MLATAFDTVCVQVQTSSVFPIRLNYEDTSLLFQWFIGSFLLGVLAFGLKEGSEGEQQRSISFRIPHVTS